MSTVRETSEISGLVGAVRHRRVPSQARSRERVQRLLDTADGLIGSAGLGALTIPGLAMSAMVPVGTIYQFFPDKAAMIDAIAERYMQQSVQLREQLSDRIARLRWGAAVETVIEYFATMYRTSPTFRELWLNGYLSPGARERDRRNNDELAEILADALRRRPEFERSRRLKLACRTAVEIADGLLRYAFTLSPDGDQATINELKRVVSGYLLEYATSESHLTATDSSAGRRRAGRGG